MTRAHAALVATLLAAASLAGVGCSRRSDTTGPAQGEPASRIVATAGYGSRHLLDRRVAPRQSVMDSLRDVTPVETAYGGGFVKAMLGWGSQTSPAADWFFYVNGIESAVGAASVTLGDGDVAWWDHRRWGGMLSVRGVVGSWPEPFVHGAGSGRVTVSADPPIAGALSRAGARVSPRAARFRALVGTDVSLRRRDAAWRAIDGDPAARGLAGGIAGGNVVLIPAGGGRPMPVQGARAVAVLVPAGIRATDGALLAVAGLDQASATAAARTIARTPQVLHLRYAVAFDAVGQPVRAAGRQGP